MKLNQSLIPLNLQLFAEETAENNESAETNAEESNDNVESKEKTFSRTDIAKMIAAEKAKWESSKETELEAAKTEAAKLAKMSADQKAEYEKNKQETALAEREAELTKRELTATAKESLADKGLSTELVKILDLSSAEKCNESIEVVSSVLEAEIQKGVEERLKGGSTMKKATRTTDEQLLQEQVEAAMGLRK